MKFLKLVSQTFLLTSALALMGQPAKALGGFSAKSITVVASGGSHTGGGRSVICRDQNGVIQSAEMLDLYEGRIQFGLRPIADSREVSTQLYEAALRVGSGVDNGRYVAENLADSALWLLSHRLKLINSGLQPIEDSFEAVLAPKGCGIEQVAHYRENEDIVYVDREIWTKFDNVSKAALVLHENLYDLLRAYGETDSVRTRRLVALSFSGHEFKPVRQGLPKRYVSCNRGSDFDHSTHVLLYFDERAPQVMKVEVLSMDGKYQFERNSVDVPVAGYNPNDKYWTDLKFLNGGQGFVANEIADSNLGMIKMEWEETKNHRYQLWMKGVSDSNETLQHTHENQLTCDEIADQITPDDFRAKFVIEPVGETNPTHSWLEKLFGH